MSLAMPTPSEAPPPLRPITDAFGTRLDPVDLLDCLATAGLDDARVVLRDDGVVLECPRPDVRDQAVSRALVALVARLSPLVSVRPGPLNPDHDGKGQLIDLRQRQLDTVALMESSNPDESLDPGLSDLLRRLDVPLRERAGEESTGRDDSTDADGSTIDVQAPPIADPLRAGIAQRVTESIRSLVSPSQTTRVTLSTLAPGRTSLELLGAINRPPETTAPSSTGGSDELHLLVWFRPGGDEGVRPAAMIAGSRSVHALHRFGRGLIGDLTVAHPNEPDILLDGLAWKVSRRPTIAALPVIDPSSPIQLDADRCIDCGVCTQVCPTGFLGTGLRPTFPEADGPTSSADVDESSSSSSPATSLTPPACTRCYECVEACPTDALRPVAAKDTATLASSLAHRPGWLSRLAGLPGPSFPSPFPPSYLLPKESRPSLELDSSTSKTSMESETSEVSKDADSSRKSTTSKDKKPRYVLGLSVMTMQEHAAVLLKDGEVVGAIEHEKLVRIRHAGWHPPNRPGITAAMDPTISLEETLCRRPIRALLESEGITLDDIEIFAVNGLHGRHVDQIPFLDSDLPIPTIRTGRVMSVPHHLCHAASTYRASGFDDAWVLTIDGRGDRECAALWRGTKGRLELVHTVLSLVDQSIGGVYEGVTRLLGFGSHGQGSVMALASFGEPVHDFDGVLSMGADGEVRVHESAVNERFGQFQRGHGTELTQDHKNLAASLQHALEETVVQLVRRHVGDGPIDALCVAGGVALNCRLNERLRQTFQPRQIFAQPGANDGGTALGAALEAWSEIGGSPSSTMDHAYLGPEFDNADIEPVLRRSGLRYRRVDSIADEAAQRLSQGQVVCWFQGGLEFGPRALGSRSILADPRNPELHERVNRLKDRESWRPFGPSVLAGHEADWLDGAFDSRFMLFTLPVKEDRRSDIPSVVHVDGSTRPQVVHADTAPRYHALISTFHQLTGVPMVLNTSFNRRGEPIVCTPDDAVDAFLGLGADALAIGDFMVERDRLPEPALPNPTALQALPKGRRLSLRLTTRCDFDCGHCTLRDQHGRPDRPTRQALHSLAQGREAGCDELVILRGEATLRDDLPQLIQAARHMGYRHIQLQTHAHRLAQPAVRSRLLQAGVDTFDIQLLAAAEPLHDELTKTRGTFRPIVMAIHELVRAGKDVLVTVPVLSDNLRQLGALVQLTRKVGVRRIQFNFPRPVELPDRVLTDPIPRLATASPFVRRAVELAQEAGMAVSTEALPLCHLPESMWQTPDATENWNRHRIDDLHLVHDSANDVRSTQRPDPPPCRTCSVRERCPKTWALYLELFGSDELKPIGSEAS